MGSPSSAYTLFGFDFGHNEGQRELIRLINIDPVLMPVVYCVGGAGTGKTFATLAACLNLVRGPRNTRKFKTIFYIREPVEIGHRLGYLKGTEADKYGPYLGPLLDNYNHLMENISLDNGHPMREPKRKDAIIDAPLYDRLPSDIVPLAPEFMRGRSFTDALLIVDEAQNMTLDEIQTMVTRIGNHSKMILIGSPNQIDVPGQSVEKNDFETSYEILKPTELVGYVKLVEPMRTSFVVDFDLRFVEYKEKHRK